MASCVGLVPARAGSKRLAHKNIRPLLDHPVIAYQNYNCAFSSTSGGDGGTSTCVFA